MPLTERLAIHERIINAPPLRLQLGEVIVPEEVELTFVGSFHDIRFSNPDYLEGLFAESDVLVPESCGWIPKNLKVLQGIARGSYGDYRTQITAEKKSQNLDNSHTKDATNDSLWTEKFIEMLYGAKKQGSNGMRVLLCDYPKRHPAVSLNQYEPALDRFGQAVDLGQAVEPRDLSKIASRDIYIGRKLCESITELRAKDSRLRQNSPLRVIMPYGTMHYALPEALAIHAQTTGVDTFKAKMLFEEATNQNGSINEERFARIKGLADEYAVTYQNWLRTPEASS